jgi:hypothetical protein
MKLMNKPAIIYTLILLCAGLLSTSCERLFIEPNPANDPVSNFDVLWNEVDKKYSYFTYKNINWDSIYQVYRPQVREGISDEALFDVMAAMLNELRDGHVNLVSSFDVSRNWDWYLDHPQNFNYSLLERNYLGRDYRIVGPFRTQVIDSVGYIYYRSFLGTFTDQELDDLLRRYEGLKGIVIDVRNNGGGSIMLVNAIASRFTSEKVLTGYSRYKQGPGHDEFTRPFPNYLEPAGYYYPKPVAVLTNRSVYSAANDFASTMSHLPQVTLVGDWSGGGGGAPYSSELPNGWGVRFSTTQLFNANMEHIESGIAPDIKVDMAPTDEFRGVDTILETALNLFR